MSLLIESFFFLKKKKYNYLSVCVLKYSKCDFMLKSRSREIIGKVVISEETGRKFGVVGDLKFVSESGELLSLVLSEPTKHTQNLTLERDEENRMLVPFSTVKSVGDFVIISEKEIA